VASRSACEGVKGLAKVDWPGPGFGGASRAEPRANSGFHGTPGQAGRAGKSQGQGLAMDNGTRGTAVVEKKALVDGMHIVMQMHYNTE
jgi:hypothetical protein